MSLHALKRAALFGGVAVVASAVTLLAVRAYAAGIPDPAVDGLLTYTGYLEDGTGAPLTDTHAIQVNFWPDDKMTGTALCTGKLAASKLTGGRFQVPLPKECASAVNDPKTQPDIWVDVQVDGNSLGPTKLGAVPFALQAGHAATADAVLGQEQVLRANISATGKVSALNAAWIAGDAAHASTGDYVVTFVAGTFSSTPACSFTANVGNLIPPIAEIYNVSKTGVHVAVGSLTGVTNQWGGAADSSFFLICVGPK